MIAHLRQKYLEEAQDLLLELEKTLLLLEEEPANREGVETAFRVMHTLKGSSGMFGYEQISELVHLLENGYDAIRTNQQAVPKALLSLSLEAVDHIRTLLDGDTESAEVQQKHKLLLKRSAELLYEVVEIPAITEELNTSQGLRTWAILFAPNPDVLQNGSNPLYILEELAELGHYVPFICAQPLPELAQLDPQKCYLSWLLLLATEASEASIQEAFLFVEGSCTINIQQVAEGDALEQLDSDWLKSIQEHVGQGLDEQVFAALVEGIKAKGQALQETSFITETVATPNSATAEKEPLVQAPASVKEKSSASIRVASDKLDDLMNLISELVANQERLSLISELSFDPQLASVAEEIEKITRQLRDKTFDICLVPIGSLLTRFKRLVRDLSLELNKNIVFEAEGVETELDKNVVESLSDCLVHIFRNSIDHGLEDESERLRKGKAAQGKILLKAYNSGTNVVLEVQDDGAGINPEKVRQKALEKGLIRPEQKLSEHEVLELLFMPGFSTARGVTAVSGRGVGMDVVRKKIKELRGDVKISSRQGEGTTITISLPLTISILDGLLVRVGETDFVLPLSFVDKSYAVTTVDLQKVVNNQLILDGEPVIFFDLAEAFGAGSLSQTAFGVVIKTGLLKVVLLVDEIVGEYQAVLKPLGRFYKDQDFLSGGSLKGDGTVALVIDPQKLIQEILSKTTIEI